MIYSVVGTNKTIREKANKEHALLGGITDVIYSETVGDLEHLIDARSLFGETRIVLCSSVSETSSSKDILTELLPRMEISSAIFIIDEPFADTYFATKLSKVSKKMFDAREEKTKDTSIFILCTSLASRNKKKAWTDFMELRNKESGEAIQGALWWKWKEVWQEVLSGRDTIYTKEECERIGKELMESSILAHKGEKDLYTELERIILSV